MTVPRSARAIYAGVMLATMLDSFALGILLPVLPFVMLDLGANAFWIGALISVQFVGGAFGSPALGRMADVVPRVLLLLISLTVIALGNWAIIWAASLPALFLIRFVSGFMASNLVIFESIITEISSKHDRSAGLARLRIGSTIGLITGPAFAAWIGHMNLVDPRTDMLVAAAAMSSLIPPVIAWTFRGRILAVHALQAQRSKSYTSVFRSFRENRTVRDLAFIKMLIAVCFGMIVGVIPVWSQEALDWTSVEVSSLMLTFGLSLLSVQIFIAFGKARWLTSLWTLALACAIVLPGFMAIALVSDAPALFLFACVIGLSSAVVNITVPSRISQVSHGDVGGMLGLMSTVVLVGGTVGPMIFGFVYDHFGYEWSLLCGAACAAVATLLAMRLIRIDVSLEEAL